MKKSDGGASQIKGPQGTWSGARSTGMPKDRQLGTAAPRAPSSGQTKMPADQGGRSSANPKE